MLTEDDLRAVLRTSAAGAPAADPWPGLWRRIVRRRRAAVTGVVLTVALVLLAVALPLSQREDRASTFSGIPLGPRITRVSVPGAPGPNDITWGNIVSTAPGHFWTVGSVCATAALASCHRVLEESADAGLTWRARPAPPFTSPDSGVEMVALGSRLWAFDQSSDETESAGPDLVWQSEPTLLYRKAHFLDAAVVGGRIVVLQAIPQSSTCRSGVRVVTLDGDRATYRTLEVQVAPDPDIVGLWPDGVAAGHNVSLGRDGSVWVTGYRSASCPSPTGGNGGLFIQTAGPGLDLSPPRPAPLGRLWPDPTLKPLDRTTAYGVTSARGSWQWWLTRDGGVTWTRQLQGSGEMPSLRPLGDGRLLLVRGSHAGELVSVASGDGRLSPTVLTIGSVFMGPNVPGPGLLDFTVGRYLVLSADGGLTWYRRGRLPG